MVRIKSRDDGNGERLGLVQVYIGDVLCGTLPKVTKVKMWYDIKCSKKITGSFVLLKATQNQYLQVNQIEAYGTAQDGGLSKVVLTTNLGNKGQCGADYSTAKLKPAVTATAKKWISKLDQKPDLMAIKEQLALK